MEVKAVPPDPLELRLERLLAEKRAKVAAQLEAALAAVAEGDGDVNLEHLVALATEGGVGHEELLERVRTLREVRRLEAEAAEHEEAASRLEKEYRALQSRLEAARKSLERAKAAFEELDTKARSLQSQRMHHVQAATAAQTKAATLRQKLQPAEPPKPDWQLRAEAWLQSNLPSPGDGGLDMATTVHD